MSSLGLGPEFVDPKNPTPGPIRCSILVSDDLMRKSYQQIDSTECTENAKRVLKRFIGDCFKGHLAQRSYKDFAHLVRGRRDLEFNLDNNMKYVVFNLI